MISAPLWAKQGLRGSKATVVIFFLVGQFLLVTCGRAPETLYVQDLTKAAQTYKDKELTVDGAYVWRPGNPGLSVLALGVSTLDNGLDAQPLGDAIWVEGFPAEVTTNLHRPGDAVYGFVRVKGRFTIGKYGSEGQYPYQIQVTKAEAIEQIKYIEHKINNSALEAGKVSFFDLQKEPKRYEGQTITTQGYYFWNSVIWVLAEGVGTEEGGSSPHPLGERVWLEGFPPDQSTLLNVGPNNSFVWGLVEVTGKFQTGGGFGKDGAFQSILTVQTAKALAKKSPSNP